MTIVMALAFGALFFAAAGYLGAVLGNVFAERVRQLPGGPAPHGVPLVFLLVGCGIIGALVIARAQTPSQILAFAIICLALVAIWVTDARRGVVPDIFTLGPLAIILFIAGLQHQWLYFLDAAIPFAPFAVAAWLSKGRGMGWGDVKLVALGGAVLGAMPAVFVFMLACIAAVIVNYARGQRKGVIAFAPYLASAIGVALPIAMSR